MRNGCEDKQLAYTGMAESNRRYWRKKQSRYCDKCKDTVYGGAQDGDEGLVEHQKTCEGSFRFYCHHCVRFCVLSKPAIRAHIAAHGNWVDESAMSKLKPVKVVTR